MAKKPGEYKSDFVKRVLKNAKARGGEVKYTNKKDFLEMIKGLPTESLDEYKNPEKIKRALKKAKKEYGQGKFLTKL